MRKQQPRRRKASGRSRKPREIVVLPSVGEPDVERAVELLVPLLLDYLQRQPAEKPKPRRHHG